MAWFNRKCRLNVPSTEIANSLYKVVVEKGSEEEFDQPKKYSLPHDVWPAFIAKMRIYREALVLLVLLAKSHDNPDYEPVLRAYEALVMPPTPDLDGMVKLEALKGAMSNLAALLTPSDDSRPLTWSRSWLSGVGHEEGDPITLTLFSTHWMDTYIAVRKSVDRLSPR
jgi:hypothetical protein